jgi:hypothetical protein
MITLQQYVGAHGASPDWTPERQQAATTMLQAVNALLDRAVTDGVPLFVNPATKSQVSGSIWGGFRTQACPQGAPHSSHKEGRGVDVYDPHNQLDDWLTDELLEDYDLYREAPESTNTWCHLTDRAPVSGKRTFKP